MKSLKYWTLKNIAYLKNAGLF